MKTTKLLKLVLSLALPLTAGAVAGLATVNAIPEWYSTLKSPPFSPPNWIFGPVWTVLYLLMGLSFYLVWTEPASRLRNIAMILYSVQLLLNFCWTFLFFYFKQIGWAFAEIVVLWIFIAGMIVLFYKVRRAAAYLNIPYLSWVSFAAVLNAAYFLLN